MKTSLLRDAIEDERDSGYTSDTSKATTRENLEIEHNDAASSLSSSEESPFPGTTHPSSQLTGNYKIIGCKHADHFKIIA